VPQACLKALLRLATSVAGAGMGHALQALEALAAKYAAVSTQPGEAPLASDVQQDAAVGAGTLPMRAVALRCLLRCRYFMHGVDGALALALQLLAGGGLVPLLRQALLESALQVANLAQEQLLLDGPLQLSADTLAALHTVLLHGGGDAAVRHLGFLLLQRLAGEPGTLYRPVAADEAGAGGELLEGARAEPSRQVSLLPQPTRTYVSAGEAQQRHSCCQRPTVVAAALAGLLALDLAGAP
jgi:hypothetical protein